MNASFPIRRIHNMFDPNQSPIYIRDNLQANFSGFDSKTGVEITIGISTKSEEGFQKFMQKYCK